MRSEDTPPPHPGSLSHFQRDNSVCMRIEPIPALHMHKLNGHKGVFLISHVSYHVSSANSAALYHETIVIRQTAINPVLAEQLIRILFIAFQLCQGSALSWCPRDFQSAPGCCRTANGGFFFCCPPLWNSASASAKKAHEDYSSWACGINCLKTSLTCAYA